MAWQGVVWQGEAKHYMAIQGEVNMVTRNKLDQILSEHRGKYVAMSGDLTKVFARRTRKEARREAMGNGVHAPIVLYSKKAV